VTCRHEAGWEHEGYYDMPSCDVHVDCDERCLALKDPKTFDEIKAALEHWRDHTYLAGCSHGY
jgi:hypothetical protein